MLQHELGCQVIGTWAKVGGQMSSAPIEIAPALGGLFGGRVYTREPVYVVPAADGTFRTPPLPPSSAVGEYTFRGGGMTLTVVVPDGCVEVRLANLLAPPEEAVDVNGHA